MVVMSLASSACSSPASWREKSSWSATVRGPVATLDDRAHIELRQALILALRVLVPALYLPALLIATVVTVLDGVDSSFPLRCAGVLALVVWLAVTLGGTVPINESACSGTPMHRRPPGGRRSSAGSVSTRCGPGRRFSRSGCCSSRSSSERATETPTLEGVSAARTRSDAGPLSGYVFRRNDAGAMPSRGRRKELSSFLPLSLSYLSFRAADARLAKSGRHGTGEDRWWT